MFKNHFKIGWRSLWKNKFYTTINILGLSIIAEPNFFQMFSFKLMEGNIKDALAESYAVLLTKNMEAKYFGDWQTAMGKALQISGSNIKVTGILENHPSNIDFPLGIVLSYASLVKNIGLNDWRTINNNNYVLFNYLLITHQSSLRNHWLTR
jgi:hypothetical protein